MAEITPETLRNTIRFRGDYQNVRKFPNADVDTIIQLSFAEFYQIVNESHEGYWDTQTTLATTRGVPYVALPKDVWSVQGVDIDTGNGWRQMPRMPMGQRNRFSRSMDEPMGHRISARGIEMLPTPDAVYSLRIMYTPKAPQLMTSQPREWFNGWEDYVVNSALLKLDDREKKPLGDRVAILERCEKMLRSGAREHNAQEPEYLNLREGVHDDFYTGDH